MRMKPSGPFAVVSNAAGPTTYVHPSSISSGGFMAAKSASVTIARDAYDAVIFDLDGVITRTAKTHAAAWKAMFDEYLQRHAAAHGEPFRPFDMDHDYRRYVDGKPRYDGVASFLASRGIHLPHGSPDDPPQKETVCGLG